MRKALRGAARPARLPHDRLHGRERGRRPAPVRPVLRAPAARRHGPGEVRRGRRPGGRTRSSGEGRQLCIDGLAHGKRYEIQVRAGLPSEIGETLLKPAVVPVYVRDRAPSVRFSGKSYVLPSRGQQGLPVVTDQHHAGSSIEIYRVGDRNLNAVTGGGDFLKQLTGSDIATIANESGAKIYSGEPRGRVQAQRGGDDRRSDRRGDPRAEARRLRDDRQARRREVAQRGRLARNAVVHRLRPRARPRSPATTACTRSCARWRPPSRSPTPTCGWSRATTRCWRRAAPTAPATSASSRASCAAKAACSRRMLVAETANGQYAFLDLATAAFDLSDRGVKGRDKPGALDAFLYADRGVYRPGETRPSQRARARPRRRRLGRADDADRHAARRRRAPPHRADRPGPRRPRAHAGAVRLPP